MGNRKTVSEFEKGQILAYNTECHSNRKISEKIGLILCVVNNFLKDKENYRTKILRKTPKCFDDKQERIILRAASN